MDQATSDNQVTQIAFFKTAFNQGLKYSIKEHVAALLEKFNKDQLVAFVLEKIKEDVT